MKEIAFFFFFVKKKEKKKKYHSLTHSLPFFPDWSIPGYTRLYPFIPVYTRLYPFIILWLLPLIIGWTVSTVEHSLPTVCDSFTSILVFNVFMIHGHRKFVFLHLPLRVWHRPPPLASPINPRPHLFLTIHSQHLSFSIHDHPPLSVLLVLPLLLLLRFPRFSSPRPPSSFPPTTSTKNTILIIPNKNS